MDLKIKALIVLSYLAPLLLPWRYSLSMLGLAPVLLGFLLFYRIRRRIVYRAMQKETGTDLSHFVKWHFLLTEKAKYIVAEEELMTGFGSEKSRSVLVRNRELLLKTAPARAGEFIRCRGRVFVLRIWLVLTLVFAILFR